MIVDFRCGDVLAAHGVKHLAFAVNSDGYNDAGFAGLIASQFWPGLAVPGELLMGSVVDLRVTPKPNRPSFKLHALVCHSLSRNGWSKTPEVLNDCLSRIEAPEDAVIDCVLIGSGPIGRMAGADVAAILGVLARHERKFVVWTRDPL